jgi:hypothetical protein
MSQTVVFIVGAVVFAITVYGAIMAGGLALTRRELEGNEELRQRVDPGHVEPTVPIKATY